MKLPHVLLLAPLLFASALAQDSPPPPPPPASAPVLPPDPPAPPVEIVQPAIPVIPMKPEAPAPPPVNEEIRKVETALKRQMMFVGMGCGVLGLLIGMMIGRKTAPRPTIRRF